MDPIIAKVKKLFALAENNNSEEEAQAALEMARKLLQDHGLSMMDLKVEDQKESLAGEVEVELEGKKILFVWMLTLADVVASYFDVGFCYWNSKAGHTIWFYGNRANCQAASVAYPSLVKQIETLSKKYRHPRYAELRDLRVTLKLRESYKLGLIKGFAERLVTLKDQDEEQVKTTALAVYNKDLQEEWLNQTDMEIETVSRPRKTVNDQAYKDGQRDSDKLSLGSMLEDPNA